MLDHPISWTRKRPIEPLPLPWPWRRMAYAVLWAAVLIGAGYVVVVL